MPCNKNWICAAKLAFYGRQMQIKGPRIVFGRTRWTIRFDEDFREMLSVPPLVEGQPIDLFALPILPEVVFGKDPTLRGFEGAAETSCFVNEHSGDRIITKAGDDCLILGYPLNNSDGVMLPIWKRGSIATETNIGVDGRPIFLVDATVTPAMSGSPIFRKTVSLTAQNINMGALQEFRHFEFIGVYAGRLERADLQATNLGYAWYQTFIERVRMNYSFSLLAEEPLDNSFG